MHGAGLPDVHSQADRHRRHREYRLEYRKVLDWARDICPEGGLGRVRRAVMERAMPDQQETAIPVLLVEDNEIDVEITKRVLAASGLNVRLAVARDGNEALDVLFGETGRGSPAAEETQPPRLIMLDLGLPGIDGREVLRRIKNDPGLRS